MTKTCSRCGVGKPLTHFSPNKFGKHGRLSRCRVCVAEVSKERYYANLEKNREAKAASRRRQTARRKLSGEISRDYAKWASMSSDLCERVEAILTRCRPERAERLCFLIMTSGQDKWRRFSFSHDGDEILSRYSGV